MVVVLRDPGDCRGELAWGGRVARLGDSRLISSSSTLEESGFQEEGAFELGLRSFLDSGMGGILALPFQDSRSSPWPWPPLCAGFVCCSCYLYYGVLFSFRAYPLS